LAAAGAEVVPVDPLRDEALPEGTTGLVVGGGFPEVYAEQLSANEGLRADVAALAGRGAPVVVWGVGQLTFKLLAMTRLADIPVRAFLDTNPAYHGMTLRGAPILPPEAVVGYTDPVLVGTMLHAGAIETRLRELGAANPVLRLAA
jgi:cobyrinic acid a,c-diamide synthase